MIPLDHVAKWTAHLDASAQAYLSASEFREYENTPAAERQQQIRALLEQPIASFTIVNDVYFRARWSEVLSAAGLAASPVVLEIASGDTDVIPQMMGRDYPNSRYLAANMNRRLTAGLREKTRNLPLEVAIIEDDAAAIGRHLQADSVDVIAFQHGVNDVLQAILCDRDGVDTIQTDWMETLPAMIAILQRETRQGTLDQSVRPGFLSLLETLLAVLKPGGVIAMNHYMFQLDLDWGYPPDVWENLIPMVRGWVKDLPGAHEIVLDGFDRQWWLFLRKP